MVGPPGVRFRLPAVAVLGLVGLLTAGAAILGVATSTALPASARAFAASVLAEATVPPGGLPTRGIHTLEVRWLGGWGWTPGVRGVMGLHGFYLYNEPPTTVADYIEINPPAGVRTIGTGTANGIVKFVTEKVPVSGPDEYAAWLTYSVAPTNGTFTKSELRIDSKTVWVPARTESEQAPSAGLVEVTGFRTDTVRKRDQGPVTVVVSQGRARHLLRDLDGLPRGASGACRDAEDLWSVTVRPSPHSSPSFTALGAGCDASVFVTIHGRTMPVLVDRGCVVLRDVAALVPKRARGTIAASRTCPGTPT